MLTVLALSETREQHDEQQAEQPSYKFDKVYTAQSFLTAAAVRKDLSSGAPVMTKPSCVLDRLTCDTFSNSRSM